MDYSLTGSSVHGILQVRILGWVAISFSKGWSRLRDWTHISWVSCIGKWVLSHCGTWEALASWYPIKTDFWRSGQFSMMVQERWTQATFWLWYQDPLVFFMVQGLSFLGLLVSPIYCPLWSWACPGILLLWYLCLESYFCVFWHPSFPTAVG